MTGWLSNWMSCRRTASNWVLSTRLVLPILQLAEPRAGSARVAAAECWDRELTAGKLSFLYFSTQFQTSQNSTRRRKRGVRYASKSLTRNATTREKCFFLLIWHAISSAGRILRSLFNSIPTIQISPISFIFSFLNLFNLVSVCLSKTTLLLHKYVIQWCILLIRAILFLFKA